MADDKRDFPEDIRVLMVEDDEPTCLLLRTIMPDSAELVFESDPHRAVEVAGDRTFDLVLLDIHLGSTSMGGIEIMRSLREFDAYAETPMVAVTAYAMPGDRTRFLEEGFDAYLSKPFSKKGLYEVIEEVVSG